MVPTLTTLREKLLGQPEEKAKEIALSLELFTTGSLGIFGHRSTVDLDKRVVVFDIHGLGEQLKPIGHLVITDTMLNWKKGNINYPVIQTIDNPNFYLKYGFEKQYSNYGVPYVQENCGLGVSDNIIVYGHNMNNGSMFADLCKYDREDFYREHPIVRFDTLSSLGEYEIIAAFKTVAYS